MSFLYRLKKFSIFLFILGLYSTVSAHAASPSASPNAPRKIKIALNWVPESEFGGFYEAQVAGLFKKENLDVELIPGGAGSPTAQMLSAKKVDFAVASGNEIIMAQDRGAKILAIFNVFETSPLGIMARKDRNLKSLGEVFEKGTLAIEKGQTFYEFLKKKFGFEKVKVVPYTGGIAQFLRDPMFAQQCFVFSEPVLAEREGVPASAFLLADAGYNPYMEVLAVREDWLTNEKSVVEAVVRAVREGWSRYQKNPKAANERMAELNKAMDLKTFEAGAKAQVLLVESSVAKKIGIGKMTDDRWLEMANQLKELKIIKAVKDPKNYYSNL